VARTERPGLFIPAASLVALLLFDVLRVWLPSVFLSVGTSELAFGVVTISVTAIAPLVAGLLPRSATVPAWTISIGLLLVGRLALQIVDSGPWQLAASSVALLGASIAIGILAGAGGSAATTRFSVLLGVAASSTIHVGLAMTDLAWRTGFSAWAVTLVLLGATGASAWQLRSEMERDDDRVDASWPWWLLGPIILLLSLLVLVPGRVATATRWSDPWIAATVVTAAGLLVLSVLVGRWLRPSVAGPVGAGLTLAGTAGALQAASGVAVASQLGLAVGLGLVVSACDQIPGHDEPRAVPVAIAGAGFPLVLVLLSALYYAGNGLAMPFPNRLVLLVVSVVVAIAALSAGAQRDADLPREPDVAGRLLAVAGATTAFAILAAVSVSGAERTPGEPGEPGDELRVALVNLQMGYDPNGRLTIHEVGDMLAEHDPDIVVLNEVDRGWMTTGGRDTLRQLSGDLGLAYVFGPAADEVWGNAVLSRYPVAEAIVERLPRGRDTMSRSQLIAVIEVAPDERVAVIATQLSDVDVQGDTRLPQVRSIVATVARLQERGVPVILAGDLRAEPSDAELTTLADFASSVLPDGHPTWPSWAPERQVDHILTDARLRVREAEVLDAEWSAHRPILTVLELSTP
jgi:endonuclease/exonuclease/phosphatase family metal-dependent hydrolase